MSKMTVKEYINHYTRDCSNEGHDGLFIPWLTPDNARIAAMMARKEVIDALRKKLPDLIFDVAKIGHIPFYAPEDITDAKRMANDFIKEICKTLKEE